MYKEETDSEPEVEESQYAPQEKFIEETKEQKKKQNKTKKKQKQQQQQKQQPPKPNNKIIDYLNKDSKINKR